MFSAFKELLLSAIGFSKETRARKFLDQRTSYLSGELTNEALASPYGTASFLTPNILKMVGSSSNEICVVTDREKAKTIGLFYSFTDSHLRDQFKMFDKLLRTKNKSIITQTGTQAFNSRKAVQRILKDKKTILFPALHNSLKQWSENAEQNEVNLQADLYKIITSHVAKTLLGMTILPPDDDTQEFSLNQFLKLIDDLDHAIMSMDMFVISLAEKALFKYANWLFEHNQPNILDPQYLNRHIIPHITQKTNIAGIFLLTANISNFIALSTIHFATNPKHQDEFRKRLIAYHAQTPADMLAEHAFECCFKECARLFAGPPILSRISGESITAQSETFKPLTLFEIPTRRLRTQPEFGPLPLTYNPERYLNTTVPNPLSAPYSPFGFGVRRCPAVNDNFILDFWITAMSAIFKDHQWSVKDNIPMETISAEVHRIVLSQQYIATNTPFDLKAEHRPNTEKEINNDSGNNDNSKDIISNNDNLETSKHHSNSPHA